MPSNITPLEELDQIRLSTWLTKQGIKHTASANGGKRDLRTAMKLKRMGVSPGFPDIEIPYPSGQYYGLYIELKREKGGKVSETQADWLDFLRGKGYYAKVAKGFEDAKEMIEHYFSFTKPAA